MKTQIAVADMAAGQGRCLSQSLDRAIFITSPCVNHGEISNQRCPLNGVFANRRQLDCAFAFANRVLFVPKYGINDSEGAKCSRIIGLVPYHLAKLVSRAVERR